MTLVAAHTTTTTPTPAAAVPITVGDVGRAVADLRSRLTGGVEVPGDPGYDAARAAWNLVVDQLPAVVVRPRTTADVVEAVRFAARAGLGIAVQATGHGVGRPADGAMLIVTSEMTDVRIDACTRTARIEAGAKWSHVLGRAQSIGLAPLLGSTPEVGAIGYTLGGGFGWLARKYGLAADHVRRFEVVTADGRVLEVSRAEHAELFWALCGGGPGELVIVTAMEIGLVPVSQVYGGNLYYPASDAVEVLVRYRHWAAKAPDELTSSVALINFPPIDDVPEPLRGRSFVLVRGAYTGAMADGAALVDEWRQWKAPELDMWGPMPFSEVAGISMDPVDPLSAQVSTEWLDSIGDGAIEVLVEHAFSPQPLLLFVELRHGGGQVRRGARGNVAAKGRVGEFLLQATSVIPVPELAALVAGAHQALRSALAPFVTGAAYVNFLEGADQRTRTAQAFSPEAYAELCKVKAQVDPGNALDYSLAVLPATIGPDRDPVSDPTTSTRG